MAFSRVGSITLQTGENVLLNSGVIDTVNGFAYFATSTDPAKIVKINLSTFIEVATITLSTFEGFLNCGVIDVANGFAYFGGNYRNGTSGYVVKINLSTFTRVPGLLATTKPLNSAEIDLTNGFAYFGSYGDPGQITKINLSTFSYVTQINLSSGRIIANSAGIDSNYVYFIYYDLTSTNLIRIDLSTFTFTEGTGKLDLLTTDGAYTGKIDTLNGFMYVPTYGTPSVIRKINLSTFAIVTSLALNTGEDFGYTAGIDIANGLLYIGLDLSPGKVVKVQLSDFTRVEAASGLAGEDNFVSVVIDITNKFLYFGTYTSPGIVVKFDITAFIPVPPTDLILACASKTAIILNWTDNSGGTKQSAIERMRDDEVDWTQIDTVPVGQTTYTNSNLSVVHAYSYRVKNI